jgi:hypothetical protein
LGTAAGAIVIFINWLLNRKKLAEINNILAVVEEIYETEQQVSSGKD